MSPHTDDDVHGRLETAFKAALVSVGVAAVACWLVLAITHLGDRYRIGHVQGHWMALASYATEGTLYPPLYDGVRFGGTRHMPLPIVVNAAASRLTGEYIKSGKAVALGLFASLLLLMFATLRYLRCPWPIAVGLCGLLPATTTGVLAGSTPGGDVLPVVLQVSGLLLATAALRRDASGWLLAAGVLAGLATASKLTGIWAALAVMSWLGSRKDWRRLALFAAPCCAAATLTLGLVQWASEGRFLTTFRIVTFAGGGGSVGWIRAPSQLAFFGLEDAPSVWMMVPFALLGSLAAWRASALTVYHHALGWSVLLTLIVFTDIGAGLNQLLDPSVLTIAVVGAFASRASESRLGAITLETALALTVIWAGASGLRGLVPDLRAAVIMVRGSEPLPEYDPRALAGIVGPGQTLLSEDPGVPVLLGQTPIVLDAFMVRHLDKSRPEIVDALVERIERGGFSRVALMTRLDDDDTWWRDYHFGTRVAGALRRRYVFVVSIGGYQVYEPKPS